MADEPRRDYLLAQFGALHDEIMQRSGHQHAMLNLDTTALGTIAGFVLANKADPLLLLVIPFLSFVFGGLWYDHAINIDRIAVAKADVESKLAGTTDTYETSVPTFEREGAFARFRVPPRFFPLGVALFVLFVGAPTLALVLSAPTVADETGRTEAGLWLVWAAAAVLTLGYWLVFALWATAAQRGER